MGEINERFLFFRVFSAVLDILTARPEARPLAGFQPTDGRFYIRKMLARPTGALTPTG